MSRDHHSGHGLIISQGVVTYVACRSVCNRDQVLIFSSLEVTLIPWLPPPQKGFDHLIQFWFQLQMLNLHVMHTTYSLWVQLLHSFVVRKAGQSVQKYFSLWLAPPTGNKGKTSWLTKLCICLSQGIATYMLPVEAFATMIKFFDWQKSVLVCSLLRLVITWGSKIKLQLPVLDLLVLAVWRSPWSLDRPPKSALMAWFNFDPGCNAYISNCPCIIMYNIGISIMLHWPG